MDAFFASVEQRDNPDLQGKPVAVGGSISGRGVVAAASYEARAFGVRSAMPAAQAARLCPELLFVQSRISVYRRISRVIMGIFRSYTDLVEPLSLDEAFLDVTVNKKGIRYASTVAKEIRETIKEYTGLTASAGVAPNKFLAKIASDMNKPDGLMVIQPNEVETFLQKLPVRKIPGVGKVTEEKMIVRGIHTAGDLQRRAEAELVALFGKHGHWYYRVARGIDDRPVRSERERKSYGAESTFSEDVLSLQVLQQKLSECVQRVKERLSQEGGQARTITVKVTYADFVKVTRSESCLRPISSSSRIEEVALRLLDTTEAGQRPIRLVGVSLSNLSANSDNVEEQVRQLAFDFGG